MSQVILTAERILLEDRVLDNFPYLDFAFDPFKTPASKQELALRAQLHARLIGSMTRRIFADDQRAPGAKVNPDWAAALKSAVPDSLIKTVACLFIYQSLAEVSS
ncbi:MAG: hypothetical protein ACRD3W_01605, partial [Terriglobales bacterium]